MSARAALTKLADVLLTAAALAIAWQLWERVPALLARTPLGVYRALLAVLAIFAVLSALDWLSVFIRARLQKRAGA